MHTGDISDSIESQLFYIAREAITKYHELSDSNKGNFLSLSSGGQKSETNVLPRLVSPEVWEGQSFPCLFLGSADLLAIFGILLCIKASLYAFIVTWSFLCICLCPNFPFNKDTHHIGLGLIVITSS